ncbi:Ankyrin repeat domain-containing protein 10 [Trichinella sp. T8]|nr:Ankyrin repeat domain-containing protein 10 [Trichinella sp. T8]
MHIKKVTLNVNLNANKNFQTDDILVYNCFHLLITTICVWSLIQIDEFFVSHCRLSCRYVASKGIRHPGNWLTYFHFFKEVFMKLFFQCMQINCLRKLLERHRDLTNRSAGLNRVHPLHCCALGVGCVDCLDALIAAGAQPNVQDILGETVAHKAARLGRVDFISKLLAIGCDLSVVNWIGLAAAEVAQMQGHTDCAAYAHRSAQLQQQGLFPPYNHHDAQNGVAYERYLQTVKADSQNNPYAYVTGMYGYVPLFSDDTVMEHENGKGEQQCFVEQGPCVVANGDDAIKLLKATAAATGSKRIADADDAETLQAIKRTKWSNGYVTRRKTHRDDAPRYYPIGRHPLGLTFDLGYEIQQLQNGQVDGTVDEGVVEIVAEIRFQLVALFDDQLQVVVGEITLVVATETGAFPSSGRFERAEFRRPNEHDIRLQLGTAEQNNRPRMWIQNANSPLANQPLDAVERRTVQVALEFAVLDQSSTPDPVFHLNPAGETVVDAVGFAGARRPAGIRYRGGERVRPAGKQASLQLAPTDARRAD